MKKYLKTAAVIAAAAVLSGCRQISELPAEQDSAELPQAGSVSIIYEDSDSADEENAVGKYVYEQLSDKEKIYYDGLKKAAEEYAASYEYPDDVDQDTARKIFAAVYNQEPQLFWLDSIFYPPNENVQLLKYRFDRERTEQMQSEIDSVCADIDAQTEGMSVYDKLLFFHDSIVRGCTFSMDDEYSSTVYGALCGGFAQCEGYAFTYKYLCDRAGIDCMTVTGTNSSGSTHAWNIVDLNGIWYNVDCTWDDPILDPVNTDFLRRYYFLVPDSDILNISHFRNEEYFTYPKCYDSGRTYFAAEGFLAKSSSDGIDKLKKSAVEALSQGHYDAEVRFERKSDYTAAQTALFDLGDIRRLINSAAEEAGVSGQVTAARSKRYKNDELYIIHITMAHSE